MTKEEKAVYWRQRIEEQSRSGLTIKEYCAREGLAVANLHYWRRRFLSREQDPLVVGGEEFLPVTLTSVSSGAPVEIRLCSGRSLHLRERIAISWLQTLVQVLEGSCG